MPNKRAYEDLFIEGAIKTVAEIGIENMRTKMVADSAGFSEATMFRIFPTKEILLREAFLEIDKRVSAILTESDFVKNPDGAQSQFEFVFFSLWRDVYRYLIEHREETIFLIRYRYSSLYTEEVRSMRQAYSGSFDRAVELLEARYGKGSNTYRGFLISYIFDMTLCFAEKILMGRVIDNSDTEYRIWMAIYNATNSITGSNY